ncbi:YadA-like family protein, partial [Acinetobacter nectaris]|uniref:YadA-like family protein n=1 Tax=Acinetobacter nectaris TaxID=1219382 RepID=UPI001F3463DC
ASDAVNKGQLDVLATNISKNVTNVTDGNGHSINIADQVVNKNINNVNDNSLFLTYNKSGQTVTDQATIGDTIQSMNRNGIKYAHTNGDLSKINGFTNDSSAGGIYSTAIGVNAIVDATADNAVALGVNTKADSKAISSVVIGNKSKVSGASSVAIGDEATASGMQSISIGTGNTVSGNHAGALGDPSTVSGDNSYSVGNNNNVSTNNTFAIGNNIAQTMDGSVVLGTGSASRTAGGIIGYTPTTIASGDKQAVLATTSTTGSVAVGDATNGVYRQITGVAAGTQDSDAVNLSQLKSVNNKVDTSANSIVSIIGGNSKVNTDGSITAPSYNISGQTQTTISGALNALNTAVQEANTTGKPINVDSVTAGNTVVGKNGISMSDNAGNTSSMTASNVVLKDSNGNATTTTASGMTVVNNTTGTNAKYNADSTVYTAKDGSSTYVGTNGLNFKDSSGNSTGPSVSKNGIDAGGTAITNVAAGKNATDAVNKGQLDSAVSSVNTTVSNLSNASVQYDKNADGSVNKGKITLGGGSTGTTITNVADGAIQQGSKDAVNGGQVAAVRDNLQNQITTNSNSISNIQNTVSDLSSGKSGIVQQADNNSDISIGKASGGTKVTVSGTSGNRQVTGVANGAVSSTSSDAMNGSQLYTSNSNVASYLGGGATVGSDGQVTAPSYTLSDGKTYHDVGSAVSSVDGRVSNLESAFVQTGEQINRLRNQTNAGIAGAMAVGNLPQPSEAGMSMVSAGLGGYRGEGAVSVGVSAITDSNKYIWKFGASADTRSNVSGAVSVGYQWK